MTTSAFISRNEESMPTVEIGDTVTGSQLAAISAEALRNVGWKALRTTHCECEYTEAGIIEAPLGEPPDTPEASPTIVLRPSPNVQALAHTILELAALIHLGLAAESYLHQRHSIAALIVSQTPGELC